MIPIENMSRPRNLTYEKVYTKALEVFMHDRDKTNAWWTQPQEIFDNKSPYEMIRDGKARKVMKILERCGV